MRASPTQPTPQVIVTFTSGSAALTSDAKTALKAALAQYGNAEHITVAGRTDSPGSASLNRALARARASAVRNYLVTQMPALQSVVQLDAQGSCCFKAANDNEQGRARNRRVEVTFSGGGA
jgi:outer membrane protein OmpA-like peptidoglycan-associated protein